MAKTPKPLVYGGRVTVDGDMQTATLHIDNPLLYRAALKHLEGRVTVTIAPEEDRRSVRANNYYRGVVLKMIADETGHAPDDFHEWFRLKFNSKLIADPDTGEELRIGLPTRTRTVAEFSTFLDEVMLWAAEKLGMTFPPPRAHEEYREGRAA